MVKPVKFGHFHLVYRFTVPLNVFIITVMYMRKIEGGYVEETYFLFLNFLANY